ncbi:MAG: glycoside hydrolase family 5 protein [Oscillospiraceae bacterium]|nr:glycoside hydrolase family 5 protein [Oscillospiraceae bacterium]
MKLLRKSLLLVLLSLVILLGACSEKSAERDNPDDPGLTIGELRAMPITDLTALEMARIMGHGVNLGNTMEACDSSERIPMRETSVYETMWGNPVTTRASIDGMKAAGFSTLRVPVAWTNAMNFAVNNELDYENWDFTIDPRYLDRIEEIIGYAIDAGMIVIVNNHWDHGWWSMFGHPEQEIRDLAMEIYTTMWTQIAERYNHFDGRLVLESANEELGNRLNDRTPFTMIDGVMTPGTLTEDECYEMTTKINQTFIDTVRATGGNNAERFLLVKGYNTDVIRTMDDRYVMPVDPANKLILGVHYYTPWGYCGDQAGVTAWGTTAEVEEMNNLLGMLSKFTEQGYGILLGEWGVLDNVGDDRYSFFTNFLALSDKYGYATTLWDTGGLYCRTAYQIKARRDDDPAIDKIAALFKSLCVETRADMTITEIIAYAETVLAANLTRAADRPMFEYTADEAYAWIMFNSSSWDMEYSVGDIYRPERIAAGIVPTDAEITGAGTYTVALDFTGTENGHAAGIAFSALAIMNGETLWPGYIIEFTEVLINGEPAVITGEPYTTNDNPTTTRVNLYNEWVSSIDTEAGRTVSGHFDDATASPLISYISAPIETLVITFDFYER